VTEVIAIILPIALLSYFQFRHMLQSVVVDGNDVLVSAKEASQISLARMEARETAAKAKAKREEERVTKLKKVRGEKWLPSIAKQMKVIKCIPYIIFLCLVWGFVVLHN
jgi:hypothetical protein